MKIRATLFAAALCALLAVPAAAAAAGDQGNGQERKEEDRQAPPQTQEQREPTEAEKRTDEDDREPDSDRDNVDRDASGAATGDAIRFHGLDKDGDGRITRTEWNGDENAFRQHDTDGDGVLAGMEITPAAEPLTDNEDPEDDWREWWTFHQGRFDPGAFDGLDQNDDQVVSREEWAGGFALFDRLDRDHNGSINQVEYESREFREMTRESLFGRLDVNQDGRLVPAEWWWSRDTFALVDVDSSGFVTPEELMNRGQQPRR